MNKDKIAVYNMNDDYKELEGVYDSIKEIYDLIRNLRNNDLFDKIENIKLDDSTLILGRCKNCGKFGNVNNKGILIKVNSIFTNYCENNKCINRAMYSKWSHIELDDKTIYTKGNGVISSRKIIGYKKFL